MVTIPKYTERRKTAKDGEELKSDREAMDSRTMLQYFLTREEPGRSQPSQSVEPLPVPCASYEHSWIPQHTAYAAGNPVLAGGIFARDSTFGGLFWQTESV